MAVQIRNVNRDQLLLLSPSIDDWVAKNDSVRFYVETVEKLGLKLEDFHLNHRGTGDKMYDPLMMLTLVLYSFSQGRFSTRKMEKAARNDIPTRFITANQIPDHTTIARFINNNEKVLRTVFTKVLLLAKEMGLVQMKCVSLDGSCFRANASVDKNRTTAQLREETARLQKLFDECVAKTREAELDEADEDEALPEAMNTPEKLRKQLELAKKRLQERQRVDEEAEAQMSEKDKARLAKYREEKRQYEQLRESRADQVVDVSKKETHEDDHDDDTPNGGSESEILKAPKPPLKNRKTTQLLYPTERKLNTTDIESRHMTKRTMQGSDQCWNVQVAMDADTRVVVGGLVTNGPDVTQLLPTVASIPSEVGHSEELVADRGYFSKSNLEGLESQGIHPTIPSQVPITPEAGKKNHLKDPYLIAHAQAAASPHSQTSLRKRKTTVEPLFGCIKSILGFRAFLRRGLSKVNQEFLLLLTTLNLRRLSGEKGFQW